VRRGGSDCSARGAYGVCAGAFAEAARLKRTLTDAQLALVTRRFYSSVLLLSVTICCVSMRASWDVVDDSLSWAHSRRLASTGGCSSEHQEWIRNGGWVLYVVGILYMFLGIAIVCDDYFVSSLEKICDKLGLSEDVAGATFMAAGSSAPELFSSGMSLISPDATNEIGISAIVGSAVFNMLFIVGATVLCAGCSLDLDWRPVTRDCMFYAMAVLTVLLIFYDGRITWYEGLICVLLYATYVLCMCYNDVLMRWMGGASKRPKQLMVPEPTPTTVPALRRADTRRQSRRPMREEVAEDEDKSFEWPDSSLGIPLHVISLPWRFAFHFSIPNCALKQRENWFAMTFLASISWISLISYCMVSWAARVGCVIGIPEVVMGTLVVAAGTSIPDALGSIAVAKAGEGDMAVANAVGSNIFDIWLGLGLPWLIILPTKPGRMISIQTSQLIPSMSILFGVLLLYYLMLFFNRWQLTRSAGIVFMCMYVVFACYCIFFVWLRDVYKVD
jgi:solute carrier family 24 (sodium/potassium/calcium exchanger), member 5